MSNSSSNSDAQSRLASITRGASLFFLGRILSHVLKFILSLLLTRGLGASLYGIYSYATTITSFAIVLSRIGTGKALLKFVPAYEEQPSRRNYFVGLAYLTALVGSISVGLVLYVFAPLISSLTLQNNILTSILKILALALPFNTVIKLTNELFRGVEKLEYQVFISDIIHPVSQVLVVGIAFFLGYSLLGIVSGFALTAVLVCLLAVSLSYNQTTIRPSTPKYSQAEEAYEFYNFSLPLVLKDVGSLLYNRVDILMVGFFLVESSVGIYRISVLVASLVVLPLSALNQLFPSAASRLYFNDDLQELESLYETITRWSLTISIFPALVFILYSTELLQIFGPEFTAGTLVLVLFTVGQLTDSAVGPSGYMLMMTDNQYINLINQWSLGILNIILNYILLIKMGLIGAALATASVLALLNIIRVFEVWYFVGLSPYSRSYWKPLVAGGITAVILGSISQILSGYTLLVGGSLTGGLLFCFLLLIFGIEQQDQEFFNKTIRKKIL